MSQLVPSVEALCRGDLRGRPPDYWIKFIINQIGILEVFCERLSHALGGSPAARGLIVTIETFKTVSRLTLMFRSPSASMMINWQFEGAPPGAGDEADGASECVDASHYREWYRVRLNYVADRNGIRLSQGFSEIGSSPMPLQTNLFGSSPTPIHTVVTNNQPFGSHPAVEELAFDDLDEDNTSLSKSRRSASASPGIDNNTDEEGSESSGSKEGRTCGRNRNGSSSNRGKLQASSTVDTPTKENISKAFIDAEAAKWSIRNSSTPTRASHSYQKAFADSGYVGRRSGLKIGVYNAATTSNPWDGVQKSQSAPGKDGSDGFPEEKAYVRDVSSSSGSNSIIDGEAEAEMETDADAGSGHTSQGHSDSEEADDLDMYAQQRSGKCGDRERNPSTAGASM